MKLELWEPHVQMPVFVGELEVHSHDDAYHVIAFDVGSVTAPLDPPRTFRVRFANPAGLLIRDEVICWDDVAEMTNQNVDGYQFLRLYDSPLLDQFDDPRVPLMHYRIRSEGGDLVDVIAREEPSAEWD